MNKEFSEERDKKMLEKKYFSDIAWENLMKILNDMDGYYQEKCRQEFGIYQSIEEMSSAIKEKDIELDLLKKEINQLKGSKTFRVGCWVTYIPRKIKEMIK